ncbi:MAG: hypothetical protein ACI8TE_000975 [Francisella sp.]|jgi:hypothetical protein
MKVLVIRGYDSHEHFEEIVEVNGQTVSVTIVPIGKPIFLRKRLRKIMTEYNFDDYDRIYLISIASCLTSLVDDKHIFKIALITPFFLYSRLICQLLKSTPKDFFGCHILMMFSGRMGRFDKRLKVILTELDDITDNKYFQKKFTNIDIIKGLNHYLGENGALKIIKDDLSEISCQEIQ